MAVPSTYVKNNTMGRVTLLDGTGTPITLDLSYERGDLSIDGLRARLNEVVKMTARGRLVSVAYGERMFPTLSFTAWLPNVVGATAVAPGAMAEFMTGLGAYAGNVSTLGVNRPYTGDLRWTIEGTVFSDSADEQVTAEDVMFSFGLTEAQEGNTLSISGEILGRVVVVNGSNTVIYQQISTPTP
jgi:hypothetical protein